MTETVTDGEAPDGGILDLNRFEVVLAVLSGLVLMVLAVAQGPELALAVVVWWGGCTLLWAIQLARPGSAVRQRARRRGTLRTVLWAPFVGPFALGLPVVLLLELLGDLGF